MAQDWDIRPRSSACTKCEMPFEDKQACYSTLVFTKDGYHREDLCEQCQAKVENPGTPISTWQGEFKMPPPPEEEALKKETAESLLRRLMQSEDDAKRNVIYILAVMLERKKQLIERDVRTDDRGEVVRVYEHRKTGETFLVPDPQLRLDELEHVQQEVVTMLGGGEGEESDQSEGEGGQGSEVRGQKSEVGEEDADEEDDLDDDDDEEFDDEDEFEDEDEEEDD